MYQPVERVLSKIGNANTYQKLFIVYLFFISAFVNFMIMGPTLIYMNPLFRCTFSNDLVDESIACSRLSECTVGNYSTSKIATLQLFPAITYIVTDRWTEI